MKHFFLYRAPYDPEVLCYMYESYSRKEFVDYLADLKRRNRNYLYAEVPARCVQKLYGKRVRWFHMDNNPWTFAIPKDM